MPVNTEKQSLRQKDMVFIIIINKVSVLTVEIILLIYKAGCKYTQFKEGIWRTKTVIK